MSNFLFSAVQTPYCRQLKALFFPIPDDSKIPAYSKKNGINPIKLTNFLFR